MVEGLLPSAPGIAGGLLLATVLVACEIPPPPGSAPDTRDLKCGSFTDPNSASLCERISKNLEWTRQGHATPGGFLDYYCTKRTVQRIYCSNPVVTLEHIEAALGTLHDRGTADDRLLGCLLRLKLAIQTAATPKDRRGPDEEEVTCL
jgi:hypothetical protein